MKVAWHEFQGGYLGILPCGLTLIVARIDDGPFAGAYTVRFGACEVRKTFWDVREARLECIVLARHALQNCLHALDSEF